MIVWYWPDVLEDWTSGIAVAVAATYDDAIEALAQRYFESQSPRAAFHFSIEECREWARQNFPLDGCEQSIAAEGFAAYCHGGG